MSVALHAATTRAGGGAYGPSRADQCDGFAKAVCDAAPLRRPGPAIYIRRVDQRRCFGKAVCALGLVGGPPHQYTYVGFPRMRFDYIVTSGRRLLP